MNKKAEGSMQWIISLTLISLFSLAVLSFAIGFANDNDSSINIANDPQIMTMKTGVEGDVSNFQSESENTYASIINSTIEAGSTTTTGSGQYAITSGSTIGGAKNILLIGYQKIFGSDSGFGIFIIIFLSIITFVTILYVVKIWRAGLPD
jgi:hypothetical protein